MTLFERIKSELDSYNIKWIEKDGSLIVKKVVPDGFDVSIWDRDKGDEYTVFGSEIWHDHFEDEKEAFACFMSCLTTHCRLKIVKRGGSEYSAVMERNIEEKWVTSSWTGSFVFPFWKKKTIHYAQNNFISTEGRTGWSLEPKN